MILTETRASVPTYRAKCLKAGLSVSETSLVGVERRKDPRIPCRIPCELLLRSGSERATVHDVSRGGLGVQGASKSLSQGDTCRVRLRPAGQESFEVHAMIWHERPARKGGKVSLLGLVLTEPSKDFFDLVEALSEESSGPKLSIAQRAAAAKKADQKAKPPKVEVEKEPSGSGELAPAPVIAELKQFAVRVTQTTRSRTCRIVVAAENRRVAKQTALAEVGEDWDVLEVTSL